MYFIRLKMRYYLTKTVYCNSAVHTPMKDSDGEKKSMFVDKLINGFVFVFVFQNYYS